MKKQSLEHVKKRIESRKKSGGFIVSDKTKEKQRQSKLKKPVRYWLGKKRPDMIGKKFVLGKHWKLTKEQKSKLSEIAKNSKKHHRWTKEQIDNMPKARGEKHGMWKGGITPLIKQIRYSLKYRQWRSDIFMRDDFTCQDCNANHCWIEAHHIKEFNKIIEEYKIKTLKQAIDCEELWNLNNGKTLCKKCHNKLNKFCGNQYIK